MYIHRPSIINVIIILLLASTHIISQKTLTYDWPTGPGEAFLSDKYRVSLISGSDTIQSMVVMSLSKDQEIPDFAKEMRGGRTFNWTMFSSDYTKPIRVLVEKIFGSPTLELEIVPSPYNIKPTILNNGQKIYFEINEPKYICVNFKSQDNRHTSDGVVKHMLMIFAEPLETDVPDKNGNGVHVYSKNSTKQQMDNADIIYFPKGFHDLSLQYNDVSNMGSSMNKKGKKVYFEGGSYVHGRISGTGQSNVKIYGRGVMSGRNFKWSERLAQNGGKTGVDSYPAHEAHVDLGGNLNGSNTIEGIIVCDGAGHGVNLGQSNNVYRNFKSWAWHPNNDGIRPWGSNNKVENCFIRACDDALYNKGLTVTNTVFWQGFNGSVITTGWDGKYNTENSVLKDNYIIYPEWRGLGNNNGLVMSQQDYDMSGVNITIENMTVDGNIPALVNLKTNSHKTDFKLPTDFTGKVGKIDNILFKNVRITGKQVTFNGDAYEQTPVPSKNVIKGAKLTNGDIFYTSNVSFSDVWLDGKCLSEYRMEDIFEIDTTTTKNIKINSCKATNSVNEEIDQITVYPNPTGAYLNSSEICNSIEIINLQGTIVIKELNVKHVDVSFLPQGFYFIKINGRTVKRFLKM
jgi:hypothetical protein